MPERFGPDLSSIPEQELTPDILERAKEFASTSGRKRPPLSLDNNLNVRTQKEIEDIKNRREATSSTKELKDIG